MTTEHRPANDRDQSEPRTVYVEREPERGWRFDRTIGVSVVIGIVGQGFLFTWFLAAAYGAIGDDTRRLTVIEARVSLDESAQNASYHDISATLSEIKERVARIEASVQIISSERK